MISQDGSRLVVPRTEGGKENGSEFVFTEPNLSTRLTVLLAAGAAAVAAAVIALFWLVRRLRSRRPAPPPVAVPPGDG